MVETIAENAGTALSSLERITKERQKANTDGLTGLFNKRYFLERWESEVQKALENQRPVSIAIFDIDHFKSYNDTFGHVEGEGLLKLVAHPIAGSVRPSDVVARFGGEEFVVILTNTSVEAGCTVAERVRAAVESLKGAEVLRPVTVSGGVASCPHDAVDAKLVLEQADKKLYHAKQSGRNRVSV
ncbi:MAG: GGDEF domain-containing protein [Clostridia bacterium]|nr:GGDEF domain-containing protein [Clostridia bacterium]